MQSRLLQCGECRLQTRMAAHIGPVAIVEPGTAQAFLVETETERLDPVQSCPGVGAQPLRLGKTNERSE